LPTADGHEPRRVTEGLDRVMKRLGAPDADTLATLFSSWSELVGPRLAGHARPVSLTDATLVVAVDDPAWASQLRWLEAELIERLAEALGEPITALEVRVRPG
jgi:predicted nucleic acid-binding Zn ribbon protein